MAVAPRDQPPLRRLLSELGLPQRACRELGSIVLRRELVKGAAVGRTLGRAVLNAVNFVPAQRASQTSSPSGISAALM